MIHLALEFSSPRRSVAIVEKAEGAREGKARGQVSETGASPARPLVLIEAVLAQAEVERSAVQSIVVGLGPGSYTGIRAAIALAQGWQLARGARVWGVSTVDCIALQAQALGWFGHISIAIDAKRNEYYLSTFGITPESCLLREPLHLVGNAELQHLAQTAEALVVGPEAVRLSSRARTLFPEAQWLPNCTPLTAQNAPGELLHPIYLRPVSFVKAPPPRPIPE